MVRQNYTPANSKKRRARESPTAISPLQQLPRIAPTSPASLSLLLAPVQEALTSALNPSTVSSAPSADAGLLLSEAALSAAASSAAALFSTITIPAAPAHAVSTTVAPQHAASMTVAPQHAASMTAAPQHATSTTAAPQHAASTTAAPQHAAPVTADPLLAYVAAAPTPPVDIPVYTELPTFEQLSPFLCTAIQCARKIPAGSPSLWKPATLARWNIELTRLSALFNTAIAEPTEMNLFRAVLNFVCAPGVVLASFFAERRPQNIISGLDASVNAALSKVLKGQESKAMKVLCSNGIAEVTPAVVNELKALHPGREEELKLPSTASPQLVVEAGDILKKLFESAADFNISKDVYGWAPWLFFPVRGNKDGFISSFSRFACLLANRPLLFPSICATLLSGGALTPLHKLPEEERQQREEAGLPPKLRPINSGSLLAKTVLSAVLATPAAERAAERTAPFQLSLGTKRGVEKLIHICRAAHESQWIVGKNDFANGFNSLDRQKMLDIHALMFPEGTNIFNFFYGVNSPVFLFDEANDVILLESVQGSRQGCTAGTHGFCIAIHPLLTRLQELYPEYRLRVLTDDIIPLVPPPPTNSHEDWQKVYLRYANFLRDLKELSLLIAGLSLNTDKSGMLIPKGAPLPATEVRAAFPAGFEFQMEGIRVAGAPIGSDDFMAAFVMQKVTEAEKKISSIILLGRKAPRAAHRLLLGCGSKLLGFLAATIPPFIMVPALERFDRFVERAFFHILSPFAPFVCSHDRMFRAALKLHLAAPAGCGLSQSLDQGAVSWWASVSACLSDPLLFSLRVGLERFAPSAWHSMQSVMGGVDSPVWLQVKHLLPAGAEGLLDGSFYSPLVLNNSHLCRVTLKQLSSSRLEQYRTLSTPDLIAPDGSLTVADAIQANSHSFAGRIFQSSLKESSDFHFAFNPAAYISWCRFFLGLPPPLTLHNQSAQEGYDFPVQTCLGKHGVHTSPFLDAGGCHAASNCKSTHAARCKRHNFLARVVTRAAQEAGLTVRSEPDTYSLLLEDFSKADCRRLFPKYGSKAYQDKFKAVLNALDVVASPACVLSEAARLTYVQERIDALPILKESQLKGLRIDASFVDPISGETKWVDFSAMHTSAASYAAAEIQNVGQKINSHNLAELFEVPDYAKAAPSPSLLKREADKNHKYSRLITVAQRQTTCSTGRGVAGMVGGCLCSQLREIGPSFRWMFHSGPSQIV